MSVVSTEKVVHQSGLGPVSGSEAQFSCRGFLSPVRIFTAAECAHIAAQLLNASRPEPARWVKGHAASDHFYFSLGSRPALVARLVPLLGEDIVLWGATTVRRKPGQQHPWHTDIESSNPDGGFVSVWIGIENTSPESALQLIPGSHLYGDPIQKAAMERGVHRRDLTAETALRLAQAFDSQAVLDQPAVGDGEALIFDGRLWHGSLNLRADGVRTALLLHYAAAGNPVRVPDFSQLDWPFRFQEQPRPPVIVVHGTGLADANDIVPPPEPLASDPGVISTLILPLSLPLARYPDRTRTHHHLFEGPTSVLQNIESHASVLNPGRSPHPPHIHPEEEILLMLEGEGDVVLADDAERTNGKVTRLSPGAFAYYPSGQYHTIENASAVPITYVMFKWRVVSGEQAAAPLGTDFFHFGHLTQPPDNGRRGREILLSSPTHQLSKLHAHLTHMPPGGGYAPHVDAHDVLILVLSGEIEVAGQATGPHGVIYCSAGHPHGLRNVGNSWARYLVFEFHAAGAEISPATGRSVRKDKPSRAVRLAQSVKKRVKRLAGWLEQKT